MIVTLEEIPRLHITAESFTAHRSSARAFVSVRGASDWEGAVSGTEHGVAALNLNEPSLSASYSITSWDQIILHAEVLLSINSRRFEWTPVSPGRASLAPTFSRRRRRRRRRRRLPISSFCLYNSAFCN